MTERRCYRCGEPTTQQFDGVPCCKDCLYKVWDIVVPALYVPEQIRKWIEEQVKKSAYPPE